MNVIYINFIFYAEREISGLCFLSLTLKYWESCGVSEPGVIVITKLQDKIKATQTTITPNPSPHVPGNILKRKGSYNVGIDVGICKNEVVSLPEVHDT